MDLDVTKAQREDRVLTLLHMLGADAADEVLERLDPTVTSLLRQRLAALSTTPPPVRKQRQVLDEFERFFQFAVSNKRTELRLHTEEEAEQAQAPEGVPLTGDPLVDLEKMNIYQLAGALEAEQPRTVALLLKVASPRRIAQILEHLPPEKREQIVREMSSDPRAPEIILRRIAMTTIERASSLPTEPRPKDDPVFRMVEILRATDKPNRRQILKALEERDPEQATQINQALYQFDDLLKMDDAQIQKVLARVDSTTLSTALFGADSRIVDKIMNNLSKRARASLQEELSFRKNVTGAQLKATRQLVTSAIAESEQETE
ncbi:Flagellar motor switch protein FliG [Planctomicrobium piriforme]|uniref:Flagellar motor switch protein FliG n=1 Tax=Planctomicrobium piriforme TaxID=1576369 RepID=A0A1I3GR81_9PLAN|nr:Flagellar motor switch protein FliG [Planctomicrobium piriforme]